MTSPTLTLKCYFCRNRFRSKRFCTLIAWCVNAESTTWTMFLIMPLPRRRGHYKMMVVSFCLSVSLSVSLAVACLDLTQERKGLGSPNLARWNGSPSQGNQWTYLKVERSRSPGRLMLRPEVRIISSEREGLYELQSWYTDVARRPVSRTSAVTFKVKGQDRKVTWSVWELLVY